MPVEPIPLPPEPSRMREPVWLEPYPDVLLEGVADRALEPDARYEQREAIGLAFMVALARLAPRQRAVLVLRDVLGFRAAEVAEMLGATEIAVNRLLQRARQAMEQRGSVADAPAPGSLERFRLIPTRANGQPAFGCYLKDPHTPIAHAYGLMVLTLRGDRVAGLAGFADTAVFASFGLPRSLKE